MKKIILSFILAIGFFLPSVILSAQTASVNDIVNDPDWKIIAGIQSKFIDAFVANNIDVKNFDFNDQSLLLRTVGMSQSDYTDNITAVKEAGQRLVRRYGFSYDNCPTCKSDAVTMTTTIKNVMTQFQGDPILYGSFRNQSLGLNYDTNKTACCGFWFYACCALASATIETFPVYLAACAYCYHVECCH